MRLLDWCAAFPSCKLLHLPVATAFHRLSSSIDGMTRFSMSVRQVCLLYSACHQINTNYVQRRGQRDLSYRGSAALSLQPRSPDPDQYSLDSAICGLITGGQMESAVDHPKIAKAHAIRQIVALCVVWPAPKARKNRFKCCATNPPRGENGLRCIRLYRILCT